jgi:acyl dehydratase
MAEQLAIRPARAELEGRVGQVLGVSRWVEISQDRIDLFADATDDHQWIHVDEERAEHGPFGTRIAHGYLSLSMIPALMGDILDLDAVAMSVNYGLNRVRFTSPMPSGGRLRLAATLDELVDVDGGIQITLGMSLECEGRDKPVCVAQGLYRFYD